MILKNEKSPFDILKSTNEEGIKYSYVLLSMQYEGMKKKQIEDGSIDNEISKKMKSMFGVPNDIKTNRECLDYLLRRITWAYQSVNTEEKLNKAIKITKEIRKLDIDDQKRMYQTWFSRDINMQNFEVEDVKTEMEKKKVTPKKSINKKIDTARTIRINDFQDLVYDSSLNYKDSIERESEAICKAFDSYQYQKGFQSIEKKDINTFEINGLIIKVSNIEIEDEIDKYRNIITNSAIDQDCENRFLVREKLKRAIELYCEAITSRKNEKSIEKKIIGHSKKNGLFTGRLGNRLKSKKTKSKKSCVDFSIEDNSLQTYAIMKRNEREELLR